ncbi:MAG: hypothetical protein IJD68_05560 [Ruminococcus sp.]|nr:hypothetical protein [Ruminococcus sp.]
MKKLIAPIIVTAFVVLYVVFYFGFILFLLDNLALKIILGVIPLAFTAVMIYVLIERIKEIRSNEEDDLSKY